MNVLFPSDGLRCAYPRVKGLEQVMPHPAHLPWANDEHGSDEE